MKNALVIALCLLFTVARAQEMKEPAPATTNPSTDTLLYQETNKPAATESANPKYAELEAELKRVKAEKQEQLLKSYAKEWQRNRAAEAPHILTRKKQIEKEALRDGFTVEDMKRYLEQEKLARKAGKK
jgi:hypothetical protein